MKSVVDEMGGLDIVIDDGSHINQHVIESFQILFPHLSRRGFYWIEDLHTSYWPRWGGRFPTSRVVHQLSAEPYR